MSSFWQLLWDLKGGISKAQRRTACLCHWSNTFAKSWVYSATIKVWLRLGCPCAKLAVSPLAMSQPGMCRVSTPSSGQACSSSVKAVVLQPPFSGLDSPACRFKAYPCQHGPYWHNPHFGLQHRPKIYFWVYIWLLYSNGAYWVFSIPLFSHLPILKMWFWYSGRKITRSYSRKSKEEITNVNEI